VASRRYCDPICWHSKDWTYLWTLSVLDRHRRATECRFCCIQRELVGDSQGVTQVGPAALFDVLLHSPPLFEGRPTRLPWRDVLRAADFWRERIDFGSPKNCGATLMESADPRCLSSTAILSEGRSSLIASRRTLSRSRCKYRFSASGAASPVL